MSLPLVSDHALVRYLQRVLGLDVEDVRRRIAMLCKDKGPAKAVVIDGFNYEIRVGRSGVLVIATVRPSRAQNRRRIPRDKDTLIGAP